MTLQLPSRRRLTVQFIVVTAMIYAVIMLVELDPKVRAKQAEAFGPELWGVPMFVVCMVVETVLFLPVIPGFWHAMLLAVQALAEGRRFTAAYLFTAYRHEHLRRSWWWCMGGLAYFFAIAGGWIAWAAYKGI